MMAAVIDLPAPDSPTTPSTSPGRSRTKPSTATSVLGASGIQPAGHRPGGVTGVNPGGDARSSPASVTSAQQRFGTRYGLDVVDDWRPVLRDRIRELSVDVVAFTVRRQA
jgi:hypothetical protein